MMFNRSQRIANLLWLEVAAKSASATAAFSVVAILIYFYKFNVEAFRPLIQGACILVIAANIARYLVSKKISKTSDVSLYKNGLKISIWLNSLGWSIIFTSTAIELNSNGFDFVIMICIMSGLVAASIVTLAYDKHIFFPYQILILIPLIVVSLYQYSLKLDNHFLYLAFVYLVFFLYQCRQYKEYRSQLIQRFSGQLDLEESYAEIKKSRDAFMDQTAKLMQATRLSALGEMAGGLAHEINNSLMVILGSTQQVERELREEGILSEKTRHKFKRSTDSIQKIKGIIESLKYFSQQMEPTPREVVALDVLVQRTMNYCNELLKAHKIEFETSDIPNVRILCHPFQIIHVIFNLTKNAEQALLDKKDPGPRILRYDFLIRNHFLHIKVSDNGPGISDNLRDKIFQPFFTTKDVGKGIGLSLSMAKGIALDHHGDLTYEKLGDMTCFTLKLPLVISSP